MLHKSSNLAQIQTRIVATKHNQAVTVIAVSKNRNAAELQAIIDAGQRHFGENYLQEALTKMAILQGQDLIWHFIGPIQSNKTLKIAENFAWVHSIDRIKIAQRLNAQRPRKQPKLNVLLQINIDNEPTKSGVLRSEVGEIVARVKGLDNLNLRGFMCIPKANNTANSFKRMQTLFTQYPEFDTLSMGMSADCELAVKHGATFVRIGTDIFGKRE